MFCVFVNIIICKDRKSVVHLQDVSKPPHNWIAMAPFPVSIGHIRCNQWLQRGFIHNISSSFEHISEEVPKFILLGQTHSWKYNSNGAAAYVLIVASCEVPVETTSWNQISHKIGKTIFIEGYQVKFLLVDGKIEN